MPNLSIFFTPAQAAVLSATAARYAVTIEVLLLRWLDEPLEQARRDVAETRWQRRQRVLEADAVLAQTVDDSTAVP